MGIGIVNGSLDLLIPKFVPGSIQTSAQLFRDRMNDPQIGNKSLTTSDAVTVRLEGGEWFVYLGPPDTNAVFNNSREIGKSLARSSVSAHDWYYNLRKEELEALLESHNRGETLRAPLTDLRTRSTSDSLNRVYFTIDTSDPDSSSPNQRLIAERVFGQGDDFLVCMDNLARIGKEAKVYLPDILALNSNIRSMYDDSFGKSKVYSGGRAFLCSQGPSSVVLCENVKFGFSNRVQRTKGATLRGEIREEEFYNVAAIYDVQESAQELAGLRTTER